MTDHITIAIDAMGGENSPDKTIEGISYHLKNSNNSFYLIFGNEKLINPLIKKYKINSDKYKIIHTEKIIEDTDTALGAAKKGKDTSLWLAMESLKKGESDCVVSAGNTGALFVIAKLNLEMITNIDKPALSALWPNKNGMNVVLDLGANIECNEKNLIDFSVMGSALHKSLFENEISKVALLNIGSEEIKGNTIIKNTYQALNDKKNNLFEFCGYIEGNHIMDGDVNVIVTDGFTGNIALKTAEGTANFITSELKKSMTSNVIGKFSSLLNIKNLKKFKNKLDPRLYNGAILLGLNKPVIKSHGSTDAIGFANSLKVGEKVIKGRLIDKIKENIN
jgi:glycerol-3-phosphate acyltransferase PlsX